MYLSLALHSDVIVFSLYKISALFQCYMRNEEVMQITSPLDYNVMSLRRNELVYLGEIRHPNRSVWLPVLFHEKIVVKEEKGKYSKYFFL